MKTIPKLAIGLACLALLAPLGLLIPAWLKAGSAWGEWGTDEIRGLVGYIPAGLEKLSSIWSAALPDYAFKGWESKGLGALSGAYILSAAIGIALCAGAALLLGKFLAKKK